LEGLWMKDPVGVADESDCCRDVNHGISPACQH
jgi:hypothetical protein